MSTIRRNINTDTNTIKASNPTCVLCLLCFTMGIAAFIYSDMSFNTVSSFIDNTSEQDANTIITSITNNSYVNSDRSTTLKPTNNPIQKPTNNPTMKPTTTTTTTTTTTSTTSTTTTQKPTNKPTMKPTTTTSSTTSSTTTSSTTSSTKSTTSTTTTTTTSSTKISDPVAAISLPKLILIGGRYAGTSTLEQLLCQSTYFLCCMPTIFDNPMYNGSYDYNFQMFTNSVFISNGYVPNINVTSYSIENLNLSLTSGIQFNIEEILKEIPIQKYVKSYCDIDSIHNGKQNVLIRNPFYHQNPVTAAIFAQFALQYDTKILFQLREPIDRWYSADLSQPDDDLWIAWLDNTQFTQTLVAMLKNETYSDDDIISVYYQWYFTMKGQVKFEMINSLYCIPLMFWIKQFDNVLLNENKKTSDYFKIVQTEYMLANMIHTTKEVYCWESNQCKGNTEKQMKKNINTETIQSPDFAFNEQPAVQIQAKLLFFKQCNIRIDKIFKSRPDLVLGKWTSFNHMYDSESGNYLTGK